MILRHISLLIGKEILIVRNAYFSSHKKILSTLGVGAVFFLIMLAVISSLRRGFNSLLEAIPPEMAETAMVSLVAVIFLWLTAIIFLSVVMDSQKKFFHTADLELLMATPVSPGLVFSFRFLIFVLFSSTTLSQLLIFGFGPLFALGRVVGAGIDFYLLALPVAYLYLIIPAALGILLIMILLKFFSPKGIFRIAGLFNIVMTVAWIAFITGDQGRILAFIVEKLGEWDFLFYLLRPLDAASEITMGLMGFEISLWRPFGELSLFAIGGLGIAVYIIRKLYYPIYDRLKSVTVQEKKYSPGVKKTGFQPGVVLTEWKMAIRNYEMAQGALGMGTMLLAYFFVLFSIKPEGGVLPFLLNLGIVGFCTGTIVSIFLTPAAILEDQEVRKRQYWLLKVSPIKGKTAVNLYWQSFFLPQLILGIPFLALGHWMGGNGLRLFFPAVLVFLVMQTTNSFLAYLVEYAGFAWGNNVSPIIRFLRDFAPILFYPVFLFFLGLGYFYDRLAFLVFLHSMSQQTVLVLSGSLLLILIILILVPGRKKTAEFWERMEL